MNPQSFLNVKIAKEIMKMTPFLLFVMAILLILIFWELSKIHTRLKMGPRSQMESTKKREETTGIKVA
jgi:high-affinity Fe2+/Pb2+ permease